jgi:hypothetical protein
MIYDEALREAERRWGEKGYVRIQATEFNRFRVGWQHDGVFWVKGVGRSTLPIRAGRRGNVIDAPQFLFRQGV